MKSLYTMLMALLLVASSAVLAQTVQQSRRASDRAPNDQEELALTAMEGLMQQPAERALPIIKKVLAGSQSSLIKKRALFVLSQLDSSEADEILLQTARSTDTDLRREAIRNIGIGGRDKSLAALQQIYAGGDSDVKSQVLHAWMIADRKEEVYQAAVSAKSDDEAAEAIQLLGAMGAVDELRKLGDRPNASSKLVEAYAISGDLQSLRKIADSNAALSVRTEAVSKIGIIGDDAARSALREIYSRSTDKQIKEAALQGLLIADDDEGVLSLYQGATSPEEKRNLLRVLTTMDSDAALKAIDAALEEKK
jgi:hypothetical protein